MKASNNIKILMKQWEGLKLNAYRCPAGVLTIGYGHTGKDVVAGLKITRERAEELFESDIAKFERTLDKQINADKVQTLTQGQYDALLSFAYNVGMANLKSSTLWRKVKANPNDESIGNEFRRWVWATTSKGKVQLPGLIKRRSKEAEVYFA